MRRTAHSGIRRVADLSAAIANDIGSVRVENQDRVAIARGKDFAGRSFILVGLSDGIGGMKDGAECAAITLGSFFGAFFDEAQSDDKPEHWLSRSAFQSDLAVHSKFDGAGGATLVAVLICTSGSVHWLSVGDSRVYYSHGENLTQLSVDDTIAGQLGMQNDSIPGRSSLLQFIGMGNQLEPHVSQLETGLKGSVLLMSDGVHFIDSAWIGKIIAHSADPGKCVQRLAEIAKWCGGADNASVAMIELEIALNEKVYCQETGYQIWDSFGELQIIVDSESYKRKVQQALTVNTAKLSVNDNSAKLANDQPIEKSIKDKPKTKRTRGSRKPKEVAAEHKLESSKGSKTEKLPQLIIQFPEKAI
ncbi:MAG: serine/threonine-protein phosphatase [Proteobacteria bacterium]|nr:serine/threonine-protein phosphatase [Pseudomonadota bacterium]